MFAELKKDLKTSQLPPLALAYLGDAVYELYVRTVLVEKGIHDVNSLHKKTVEMVKAPSQARFFRSIEENLSAEELRIYKRGRNTSSSVPKKVDVADYRSSTGVETLIGYLYLNGDEERIKELLGELIKCSNLEED